MVIHDTLALLLIATAAAILPSLSRRLKLPATVLEILFGIILGRSLLGLEFAGDWLPFLAHLGFLLLMFHAGMEIDFAMLKEQSRGQLLFHLAFFGATFSLSYLVTSLWGFNIFIALVMSTTSLGLILPVLRETGLSRTQLGQSILIAATLADFLSLLGITLYLLWHTYGLNWRFIMPLPLFLGFGILLRLVRLWAWWHPESVERLLGSEDHHELGVRLSLALLFFFVALSELVHLEPVLGAFMGGAVISFVFRDKGYLDDKLSALGFGFLIPIFLINVGINFDLGSLLSPRQIGLTLKLLGLGLMVKIVPGLLMVFQGLGLRTALQVGVLLSTRLSLIIAAAAIGVREGLLTRELKDSIVLLAVITCLIGPSLFKALFRHNRRARQTGRDRGGQT